MTLTLLFWVLYVVALVFGFVSYNRVEPAYKVGGGLLFFILIGILGWAEFGAAIKGK